MKKISMVKLGLTALLICASSTAMADDSFSWTTYMRAGTGVSSDGGVEGVNEKAIGRFGNEYNTWVNSTLHKTLTGEDGAKAELTLDAYGWVEDPETTGPWASPSDQTVTTDNGSFYIGETSVKFSGLDFLPKGATLKIGQMGTSENVDALDYKFKDIGGTGVIYTQDKLQLSVLVNESRGTKIVDGDYTKGNINTKVTVAQDLEESDISVSALVSYNQSKLFGILPGSTKYVGQVGYGVGTLGAMVTLNQGYVDNKDGSAYRFIIDGHGNLDKLIVNPVLWTEGVDYGDNSKSSYTSVTAGARVTQPVTKHLEMIYEGFVNNKQNSGGVSTKDGTQYKLAAGPAIQLGMGEWVRPVARFTVTYVGGDKVVTGLSKDGEFRLGTQFESWF